MGRPKTPFLFLHIPKTGGVTFHNIITNQFRFKKHYLFKLKDANKWNDLTNDQKLKYDVVKGHFPFGGKDFYPGNPVYFTFLRNPEKQIVSHYLHIQSTPTHKFYKRFNEEGFTLKQLLRNGEVQLFDNCMTRFISGNYSKKWGEINKEDLNLAIRNFDNYFEHFGLIERYDESLLMLMYELDWKMPYYIVLNESKFNTKLDIDAETLELIGNYTKYDKELWEYAKSKFDVKITKYKERLEKDLIVFRKKNLENLKLRSMYYQLKDRVFRLGLESFIKKLF